MKNKPSEKESCSIGGCGGPGLCPGIALLIGFLVGVGLTEITGIEWLSLASTVVIGGLLISGWWKKRLPKRPA